MDGFEDSNKGKEEVYGWKKELKRKGLLKKLSIDFWDRLFSLLYMYLKIQYKISISWGTYKWKVCRHFNKVSEI